LADLPPHSDQVQEKREHVAKFIEYDPIVRPTLFKGYFQSETYFSHIASEIRTQFRCPPDVAHHLHTSYPDLASRGAFVHIRRGDYTTYALVNIDLTSYYRRAMALFPGDTHWYVCSDDLSWCREQPWLASATMVDETDERTLWLMSLCRYGGVCANSTFSWWGGWLNEGGGTVCFPDTYYTDPSLQIDNLIPSSFTKIPVIDPLI
jgi:hypothetical protein